MDRRWLGEEPRKTWSSFLYYAGNYSTGNAGRNRLKRNRISPHPGLSGLRTPVCAPRPTPASEQQPLSAPRPLAAASRFSRAQEPDWPGPRSPQVAQGRRGSTSGGDRILPGFVDSPPTHALSNLLGRSGWLPAQDKVYPRPPEPPGAGGWVGARGSALPAGFGWGQGPAPSACRLRELCPPPDWTLGPGRRPPFPGAAVMDVG